MSQTEETRRLPDEGDLSQLIVDVSPTFFVAIDGAGRLLEINRTMLQTLGYAREEVVGREYLPVFVPERDHPLVLEVFAKLAGGAAPMVNENLVVAKDGRELLVEWHGRALHGDRGELRFYLGIGIEIGERRRIEEALRRSEQRLDLHVQQTPLGVIEWAVDGTVTAWNPAAERIFRHAREDVVGRAMTSLLLPESARVHAAAIWSHLIARRGGTRSTNENVTKDGRIIVCEWYNTPLVAADGRVIGVASLVNDITEQKRVEAELRQRERDQAETIERLSAPVIDVWEGVLALPVIGAVDSARAARMTESLLEAIVRTRASFTIVDLTGVAAVDASTGHHLMTMVRATELLGTRCLVSGISPSVARTLTELDTALAGLETFSTLRAALAHALQRPVRGR